MRARETFRVWMRGVVGAFRFAFRFAHTCVRGGACAYRCACGGGVGCNGAGTFGRRRVPWLLRIHRLHKQVYDLPLTQTGMRVTAYTNTFTIYLPRTPPTKGVCVYLSRLPLASTLLGLFSIWCFLPLGVCLLGLVLLYPSARLGNRIISWYFAHLCRSSPYSCFALRLRAFRRRCGTCLYLYRLERLYWLYLRPLGTFYVQG